MITARSGIVAVVGAFLAISGCAPTPPVSYSVTVSANREHWQGQLTGSAPGASIHVERGDVITLDVTGKITYRRSYRGLVSKKSGPWGDRTPREDAWCPNARIGAIVWRTGDSGTCMSLDEIDDSTFAADRTGPLLFMVNDTRGDYGDNSGSFRVTATVRRN